MLTLLILFVLSTLTFATIVFYSYIENAKARQTISNRKRPLKNIFNLYQG